MDITQWGGSSCHVRQGRGLITWLCSWPQPPGLLRQHITATHNWRCRSMRGALKCPYLPLDRAACSACMHLATNSALLQSLPSVPLVAFNCEVSGSVSLLNPVIVGGSLMCEWGGPYSLTPHLLHRESETYLWTHLWCMCPWSRWCNFVEW
jgi:hypothetical protein